MNEFYKTAQFYSSQVKLQMKQPLEKSFKRIHTQKSPDIQAVKDIQHDKDRPRTSLLIRQIRQRRTCQTSQTKIQDYSLGQFRSKRSHNLYQNSTQWSYMNVMPENHDQLLQYQKIKQLHGVCSTDICSTPDKEFDHKKLNLKPIINPFTFSKYNKEHIINYHRKDLIDENHIKEYFSQPSKHILHSSIKKSVDLVKIVQSESINNERLFNDKFIFVSQNQNQLSKEDKLPYVNYSFGGVKSKTFLQGKAQLSIINRIFGNKN